MACDVANSVADVWFRLGFLSAAELATNALWLTLTELYQFGDDAGKRLSHSAGVFLVVDASINVVAATAAYHSYNNAGWGWLVAPGEDSNAIKWYSGFSSGDQLGGERWCGASPKAHIGGDYQGGQGPAVQLGQFNPIDYMNCITFFAAFQPLGDDEQDNFATGTITAVTVGNPTILTTGGTAPSQSPSILGNISGFTGVLASLNGFLQVTPVSGSSFSVAVDTTGMSNSLAGMSPVYTVTNDYLSVVCDSASQIEFNTTETFVPAFVIASSGDTCPVFSGGRSDTVGYGVASPGAPTPYHCFAVTNDAGTFYYGPSCPSPVVLGSSTFEYPPNMVTSLACSAGPPAAVSGAVVYSDGSPLIYDPGVQVSIASLPCALNAQLPIPTFQLAGDIPREIVAGVNGFLLTQGYGMGDSLSLQAASGSWVVQAQTGQANASLNNLVNVAVNTSLVSDSGIDLGNSGARWRNLFLSGGMFLGGGGMTGVQGGGSNIQLAGANSGVAGATLCDDAGGNATTSGCAAAPGSGFTGSEIVTTCTTITGGVPTGCSNVTRTYVNGLRQ